MVNHHKGGVIEIKPSMPRGVVENRISDLVHAPGRTGGDWGGGGGLTENVSPVVDVKNPEHLIRNQGKFPRSPITLNR